MKNPIQVHKHLIIRAEANKVPTDEEILIHWLKEFIDFIPVCPEVEIGLGIPRTPIKIIDNNGDIALYQDSTGKDYAKKMNAFSNQFINSLKSVDGFILKAASPSCAISTSKIYYDKKIKYLLVKVQGYLHQK